MCYMYTVNSGITGMDFKYIVYLCAVAFVEASLYTCATAPCVPKFSYFSAILFREFLVIAQ